MRSNHLFFNDYQIMKNSILIDGFNKLPLQLNGSIYIQKLIQKIQLSFLDTEQAHGPFSKPKIFKLQLVFDELFCFTLNNFVIKCHHSKNTTSLRKRNLIKIGHTHRHNTLYTQIHVQMDCTSARTWPSAQQKNFTTWENIFENNF